MQVHQAEFITSAGRPQEYPQEAIPEVAFCGRSNVGKSSMMNLLLGRKKLVKTSKTPGKTRRINFFDADGQIRLVDLPGYGFARVPRPERQSWAEMIETYLTQRSQLCLSILLVDIRHKPQALDLDMLEFLQVHELPYLVVATKSDKLKTQVRRKQTALLKDVFSSRLVTFSVPNRQGKQEVWRHILESRSAWEKS